MRCIQDDLLLSASRVVFTSVVTVTYTRIESKLPVRHHHHHNFHVIFDYPNVFSLTECTFGRYSIITFVFEAPIRVTRKQLLIDRP